MRETRGTAELESFLRRLSSLENPDKPFEHKYLRLNDDEYEQRYCERKADNDECPCNCDDFCCGLLDYMKNKDKTISAGNRVIDALIRDGYTILNGCVSCEPYDVNYALRCADSEYTDYTGSGFCGKCEFLNSNECPEDALSRECLRSYTAWAIERVTDAVNELL